MVWCDVDEVSNCHVNAGVVAGADVDVDADADVDASGFQRLVE